MESKAKINLEKHTPTERPKGQTLGVRISGRLMTFPKRKIYRGVNNA